jgi:hypothetical protein
MHENVRRSRSQLEGMGKEGETGSAEIKVRFSVCLWYGEVPAMLFFLKKDPRPDGIQKGRQSQFGIRDAKAILVTHS